jgi:hypothetical protein
MKGLKEFGVSMAALGFAATGMAFAPALAQTIDYGGSNGRVHYDHYRDRGDGHHHHRRHHAGKRHHDDDHRRARRNTADLRDDDDHWESGGGSYVGGNVSGYSDPGNGTYFYIERDGFHAEDAAPRPAPSARIIQPGSGAGACSNEAGVCVIRPGG